jgi:hypothetical protein
MTHRPSILKAVSAGRPLALPAGPDGQALRLSAVTRRSSQSPTRRKVALAAPVRVDDALAAVMVAEFRMELN